jgi:hypothetical protein
MRSSLLALVLAVVVLAGCGGGGKPATTASANGEASKSASQVLADAKAAVASASSLHVSGQGQTSGNPIGVDLSLVRGKGGTGSLTINGGKVDVTRIGNTVYIRGSAAFFKNYTGNAAAAQLVGGKWLKGSATAAQLKPLAAFTGPTALFAAIASSHGTLVNKGETTYNGQDVVEIRDVTKSSSLYVAATGKPYPVAVVGGKTGNSGTVTFGDWNASVSLKAPSGALDISQLLGG